MAPARLTADEYERTAAMLRGRCITTVVYYPLTGGDDGLEVEDWDFGPWHQPTMGVELMTDDGSRFSAVWNSSFSFDYLGLEVFREPMTAHLLNIGDPCGAATLDVTDHPRWAGLVGTRLRSADIVWIDDSDGRTGPLPVAMRLRTSEATVWITTGRPVEWPPTDVFWLGTDDVMVVFTEEFAAHIGIPAMT